MRNVKVMVFIFSFFCSNFIFAEKDLNQVDKFEVVDPTLPIWKEVDELKGASEHVIVVNQNSEHALALVSLLQN